MFTRINQIALGFALVSTASALVFVLFLTGVNTGWAQTRMTAQVSAADLQMKQICGSREVVSSSRNSKTTYSCKSKPARAAVSSSAGGSIKSADDGGLRSEIHCSYSESGGQKTWLGCTCKANDEGNCTNFITWCAEQGDEVGGNSGGASCSPGG
jgi:hypothetical protein